MKHSKDALKILEIFWNGKNKKVRIRSKLTDFLAAYIETGNTADPEFKIKMDLFNIGMLGLEPTGLVIRETNNGTSVWSLTKEGHIVLLKKHPTLKTWLQDLIDSTPGLAVVIGGIVGFLASIAGIIQFYSWMLHGK